MSLLAPCSFGCPVNTNVPGYINAIVNGNYAQAYDIIRENNPFPSVCAWVCPHPCEENCRRSRVEEPVNIRALKRYAVEAVKSGGCRREEIKCSVGDDNLPGGDVLVIGAGPAGLTASVELVRKGYTVNVIDRNESPGGHFFSSLPLFRLPREVLQADIDNIAAQGVDIRCGVEAGRDVALADLRERYRAVILAVGLQKSKMLPLPGVEHPGVLPALDYLREVNLGLGTTVGHSVVVIGGGDVAMDVARTALRQGAGKVTAICLESFREMPAHAWEVEEAMEEGVHLSPGWGPVEIVRGRDGNLAGLSVRKVLSIFDERGRFSPQLAVNSEKFVPADNIIMAVGQSASLGFLRDRAGKADHGNVPVNSIAPETGLPGVFAAGEVALGPGAAISAIASGREAAEKVALYLAGENYIPGRGQKPVVGELPPEVATKVPLRDRRAPFHLPPETRCKGFKPFEYAYSEEDAWAEASRCLRCGLGANVDTSRCVGCLTCLRVCPFGVPAVESRAHVSPDSCQSCGICAAACPAGAITIHSFVRDMPENIPAEVHAQNVPSLKVYVCRKTMGTLIASGFEEERKGWQRGLTLKVLPCAGALRKDWVLRDFEQGVHGVGVVSCPEGCTKDNSSHVARVEFKGALELCRQIGIETDRLALFSPGESKALSEGLSDLAHRVADLGSIW